MRSKSSGSTPTARRHEDCVRELVERGDFEAAHREVLSFLGAELRGYVRGVLGNAADGDDVFQEASVAIWKGLPKFRFESTLRTWCYAIVQNLLLKRQARPSKRCMVRLDSEQRDRLPAPSMSSLTEEKRRTEAVAAATAQLLPAERQIIILRTEGEFSFAEITHIMQISTEELARKRFHRAAQKLKKLIEKAQQAGQSANQCE